MNPFATLRARALLTGGLVITLLMAIPLAGRSNATVLLAFVAYPLLLAWAVFLARRNGVSLRRLAGGPPPPDQTIAILALVPALVALDVGSIWLVYTPVSWVSPDSVRGWLERMEKLTPSDLAGTRKLLFMAGAVLLAPVVEELIFRGLLLHRWALKWGPMRGLVATSVAFALLHPSPVNAFILGFGFGLIYLSTGSLWLTIAAHSLNNFIALELLPRLGPDGQPGGDTLRAFHEATGQALVMLAGGATILWLGRRWYWPDFRKEMPYDRTLPDSLSSEFRVPSSESAGPQTQSSLPPSELGTRNPELEMKDEMATTHEAEQSVEVATLAGGCFWCLEAAFAQLRGVERVTSGYAGGHVASPSYEAVCAGTTGHAEVVQVTFNPGRSPSGISWRCFSRFTTRHVEPAGGGRRDPVSVGHLLPFARAAGDCRAGDRRVQRRAAVGHGHRHRGGTAGEVLPGGGVPQRLLHPQSLPALLPGGGSAEGREGEVEVCGATEAGEMT